MEYRMYMILDTILSGLVCIACPVIQRQPKECWPSPRTIHYGHDSELDHFLASEQIHL